MAIVTSNRDSVRTRSRDGDSWHKAMKTAIRSGPELVRLLQLPASYEEVSIRVERQFPVFVPLGFAARMRSGDPFDPLLRQVLPLDDELDTPAGFSSDPVGDSRSLLQPAMLQKYEGRVLLITTGACAVHCRYCFRRHFPYSDLPRSRRSWDPVLSQLARNPEVEEVLLSGGDPLTLADSYLVELIGNLDRIPHLRRIRIHTRLPIMIPERITVTLLKTLKSCRAIPILVIHANHAAELDDNVAAALACLARAAIPVLNQAVLLKGVNDSVDALKQLSERLIELRVIPYYLHQLDRVQGAAHFEVPLPRGIEIMRELRNKLPGYAVPRYVQELPGEPAKTVLA